MHAAPHSQLHLRLSLVPIVVHQGLASVLIRPSAHPLGPALNQNFPHATPCAIPHAETWRLRMSRSHVSFSRSNHSAQNNGGRSSIARSQHSKICPTLLWRPVTMRARFSARNSTPPHRNPHALLPCALLSSPKTFLEVWFHHRLTLRPIAWSLAPKPTCGAPPGSGRVQVPWHTSPPPLELWKRVIPL